MRVSVTNRIKEAGNSLVVVMMFGGLVTLALGSYLSLASSETKSVMRSLAWNAALPMAEAGVEEAMSHICVNSNDFSNDGWTQVATNSFLKRRTNSFGFYAVNISGARGGILSITSTGWVNWSGSQYISRVVQISAQGGSPPMPVGLIARTIALGGGMSADSYDSSDPAHSNTNNTTTGWYDAALAGDDCFIATPDINLTIRGSCHIYGYVAAGVGGTVSRRGDAVVGDSNWNGKNIQHGHATNGFTCSFPPVAEPYSSGPLPATNAVGGAGYDYVLGAENYYITNLTSTAHGQSMYVSSPHAKLYVLNDVQLDKIVFAPGAHLDLYLAGPEVTLGLTTVVGNPTQCSVFGLPTCNLIKLPSGKKLTGYIYAPNAALEATARGAIYGAIIADSFKCTGSFQFHYDLALAKVKPPAPVSVLSWAE